MNDIRVLFNVPGGVDLPDGTCLGVVGEHNAVQLVITLPDSMVTDMDYHTVTIGRVESARIVEADANVDGAYRVGNTIYQPLTAAYTECSIVDLSVTAYKQLGDAAQVVDKTPTVYGLRFDGGTPLKVPGGLAAEVAALTLLVNAIRNDIPTAALIEAWNGAVTDSHTHQNAAALETITAALIEAWNGAVTDSHTHQNAAALDKLLVVSRYSELPSNASNGTVAVVTEKDEGIKPFSEYDANADASYPITISLSMEFDEDVSVGTDLLNIITSNSGEDGVSSFLVSVDDGSGSPEYGILEMYIKTNAVNPKPYSVVVSAEGVKESDVYELLEITPSAGAEVTVFFIYSFDDMEGIFTSEGGEIGNSFELAEGWNVVCLEENDGDTTLYSAPVNDPNDYFNHIGTFDEYDSEASELYLYDVFSVKFSEDKRGVYHKVEGVWVDFYKSSTPDDVAMLGFDPYSNLVIRDEAIFGESIMDVPIYDCSGSAYICSLYEANSESQAASGFDNGIELLEMRQNDTGMPFLVVNVWLNGTLYSYFSADYKNDAGVTLVSAGWNKNDTPTARPTIAFTPNRFRVGQETAYYDLNDLTDGAKSALRSLSQCINVSAAAMGTIIESSENDVIRFVGEIKPNRQYSFITADDCVFTFPTVEFAKEDLQFVMYLTCTADVDLSFPSGTLMSGGEINSDEGLHKLIGSYHRGADKWAVGGIDYEAVT